jgi:hypothetical protein
VPVDVEVAEQSFAVGDDDLAVIAGGDHAQVSSRQPTPIAKLENQFR